MNERPIIFSGEMARAILDGRKTQTRRVIKFLPEHLDAQYLRIKQTGKRASKYDPIVTVNHPDAFAACPYGKAGDRLWVKESFLGWKSPILGLGDVVYQGEPEYDKCLADVPHVKKVQEKNPGIVGNWANIPSIHMPRWASRITLEITNVRVERLRNISNPDIRAEGVGAVVGRVELLADVSTDPSYHFAAKARFERLWDKINGKTHSWSSNPWVWVIDFKVIKRPDNN